MSSDAAANPVPVDVPVETIRESGFSTPFERHLNAIRQAALTDHTLISVTLKARLDVSIPYRQITIRPVELRGARHLQFTYLTEKQDITKNYRDTDAARYLDEALQMPFGAIQFQSRAVRWTAQITKKGKVILHDVQHSDGEPNATTEISLAHDHEKALPLPVNRPDAFLIEVGIMDQMGRIRPAMGAKFAQINEFLKLIEQADLENSSETNAERPLEILDCGCGSAYLSFAAYHYLNNIKHVSARLTGIDHNGKLIEKDTRSAELLGYAEACFKQSAIIDYVPDVPPDILLALHACDTATDEAIAQGVRARSHLILCAPCCHHELRGQLDQLPAPVPMEPILRHGILKQRTAELLTDSLRALILRILGYKTDIIEFVSPEHTDKNLMIRAVLPRRSGAFDPTPLIAEYVALRDYWGVQPTLERLLGPELTSAFEAAGPGFQPQT